MEVPTDFQSLGFIQRLGSRTRTVLMPHSIPVWQQLHIKHNRLMLHLSVVFCVVLYIQPEEFLKPLVFSHIVGSFRSKLFWTKPDPEGFFVTNCIFQISPSLNNEHSITYEYCLAVLWKIIKYMMLKLTLDFPWAGLLVAWRPAKRPATKSKVHQHGKH